MEIELKLFATLGRHLPAAARRNAVHIDIPADSTAYDVIDANGIDREEAFMVVRNGVFMPPEQRAREPLREGDVLAIWPPVAGG